MKKNFNNILYFEKQKKSLIQSINNDLDRTYIEIGGKLLGDFHASRVLGGYDSDIKYKIIKDINLNFEFIVCISAISIIKRKKRKDTNRSYADEILNLLSIFEKDKIKCNIAITRYRENNNVDNFIKKLEKLNYNVFKFFEDNNYPNNIEKVLSNDGIEKNNYIPCTEKIVFVVAPGTNSGKFAVCISQMYKENKLNIKSTYRKFETFLISKLPINHPINLACSMAMCDVRGDDCIDEEYLRKYGELMCLDSRDKQSFEILKIILPKEEKNLTTICEFFINNTYLGIIDIEVAKKHAKKEICRRYKEYKKLFDKNKLSQIEFDEANRIYELIQEDIILTKFEKNALLKKYIDHWGFECQSNVCMEEMGELIQALCKYKREDMDEKYKQNILEELADVHNMITQMEIYFGFEEIQKIRSRKILRTQNYLNEEMKENI